jgi:hypothetical protein
MTEGLQRRIERSMDELKAAVPEDDEDEPPPRKRARQDSGDERPQGVSKSLRRTEREEAPRAETSRAGAARRQRAEREEEEAEEEEQEQEAPRARRRSNGKGKAPVRGNSGGRSPRRVIVRGRRSS